MRTHWLLATSLLALLLLAALTKYDAHMKQLPPDVAALRDSIESLNDLEDRAFAEIEIAPDGRSFVVSSVKKLQAMRKDAREAVLVGCAGQARDGLVAATDQIISAQGSGMDSPAMLEAWTRAVTYRNAAEACEAELSRRGANA